MTPAERLTAVYSKLDQLIPKKLQSTVNDPTRLEAVQLPAFEIGRLDDAYTPSLRVMVYEKDGLSLPRHEQEPDEEGLTAKDFHNWGRVINARRREAIEAGVLNPSDRALIVLVADESYPSGAHIIDYLQIQAIRRSGIGQEFMANFERILANMGYRYWWGEHHKGNIGFFTGKLGNHLVEEIPARALHRLSIYPSPINRPFSTVKFLDDSFKTNCLQGV